jgi:integrase/recombinase XerD
VTAPELTDLPRNNPDNERIKREYFHWLTNAKGQADTTLDGIAAALHRFEAHNRFKPFKSFRREQAVSFKQWLTEQHNARTGERLSRATLYGTLKALRAFFEWLSREPGFRSHVNFSDAAYFNLSGNEVRIATAQRERPAPTLEQIGHVLSRMPTATVVERRDRAVIAFTLLTGARDGATASFLLKHIDIEAGRVEQDARQVRTKARKSFTTTFFPVADEVRRIVVDWVRELREVHLFGRDDPLFPATVMAPDAVGLFSRSGLSREGWTNAGPIRAIFKRAFEEAGFPYFNPHSFRKTLALLGQARCRTAEDFKAWSQNLGHEGVLTTFSSYGTISADRQVEIIRSLSAVEPNEEQADLKEQLLRLAQRL